jgi:hypothetical protein
VDDNVSHVETMSVTLMTMSITLTAMSITLTAKGDMFRQSYTGIYAEE